MWIGQGFDFTGDGNADVFIGRRMGGGGNGGVWAVVIGMILGWVVVMLGRTWGGTGLLWAIIAVAYIACVLAIVLATTALAFVLLRSFRVPYESLITLVVFFIAAWCCGSFAYHKYSQRRAENGRDDSSLYREVHGMYASKCFTALSERGFLARGCCYTGDVAFVVVTHKRSTAHEGGCGR